MNQSKLLKLRMGEGTKLNMKKRKKKVFKAMVIGRVWKKKKKKKERGTCWQFSWGGNKMRYSSTFQYLW